LHMTIIMKDLKEGSIKEEEFIGEEGNIMGRNGLAGPREQPFKLEVRAKMKIMANCCASHSSGESSGNQIGMKKN
jgi:hypothetical protein